MRRRQPIPDVIANAPALLPGLETYYEAFSELSTCRQLGLSIGPIPWTAVDRYAQRAGIAGEDFTYLVHMVRALDDEFLAYSREKDRRERERTSDNGDTRPVRAED